MNASVKDFCLSLEEADYSSYYATHSTGWWSAITSAPCCDEICSLKVARAQVLYWPTPAPVPNVTSVIGPDGFTYISPSVYVVYYGISATAGCSNIGNTYASVTISYEQNELRTFSEGAFGAFDFADLYSNCTTRTAPLSATQPLCILRQGQGTWPSPANPSCISYAKKIQSGEDSELKHCYPQLEYPYKVRALNPEWANCESASEDRFYGVFDPPRALVSASALAPQSTQNPETRLSAAPASSILPFWPPATSSPSGATPPKPSDPAIANQGDPTPDQIQNENGPASKNSPVVDPPAQGSGIGSHSGSDPQASSNDQDKSPQNPSNNQGSDPPEQGDRGSGSKGSNVGGGSNEGSNGPKDDSQQLPQPSPSADSGPTPTIKWAGSTIQPGQSSHYTIPNIGVLLPGGPAVTTNGVEYSLAPSATAILSNGHEAALAPLTAPQPAQTAILTFADSTYTANAASEMVIGGETLTPGHSITLSGSPIYLSPDGTVAVIGSSSIKQTLVTPDSSLYTPQLTLAGSTYTADPFGNFFIADQTLTPGGAITVLNTPVSLAQGGTFAVVGRTTQPIHAAGMTSAPVFTFNEGTFTADSRGNFIIADQTLTPGGAVTVSGTPISIAADGSVAIVGTRSQLLIHDPVTAQKPIFIYDGTTYTADASSRLTIKGQTLTRGGQITVNGTTLLFNAGGAEIIIGPSTQVLGTTPLTGAEAAAITFGGQTYTEDDASQGFVIGGQTLTKGGVITVDGTPVSFAAGGTDVVFGSSTEALGVGGWIMSGFVNGAAQTSVVAFEGKGARLGPGVGTMIGFAGIVVVVEYFV